MLPARFINYCSNQTTTQGMPWPNYKPGGSGELPPQTITCIILQISHCQTTSRILTCWKHGTSRDHNNRRILYGIPHMTASRGGQRRNSTHIVVSIHYSEVITEICHSHWKHIKANWATRMCSWDESKRQNGQEERNLDEDYQGRWVPNHTEVGDKRIYTITNKIYKSATTGISLLVLPTYYCNLLLSSKGSLGVCPGDRGLVHAPDMLFKDPLRKKGRVSDYASIETRHCARLTIQYNTIQSPESPYYI